MAAVAAPLLGDVLYSSLLDAKIIGPVASVHSDEALSKRQLGNGSAHFGDIALACTPLGGSEERANCVGTQVGSGSESITLSLAETDRPTSSGEMVREWETEQPSKGPRDRVGGDRCCDVSGATGHFWLDRYRELSREDGPLGLQAAKLTLVKDDSMRTAEFSFDAGPPWWRLCP